MTTPLDATAYLHQIDAAVRSIRQISDQIPEIGVVLGSGLGYLAEEVEQANTILYEQIEGFPLTSVQGHAGKLVLGELGGRKVAFFCGRVHLYEGFSPHEVVFPIRVLRKLGAHTLLLTNASGGINRDFEAGDLMMLTDHINYTCQNPLVGPNLQDFGPRFPDMTHIYSPNLQQVARRVALEHGISLREGVYLATLGPSYETPAEIRFFRTIGADAVGMSTVLEAIAARHAQMQVAAVSCVANLAAGDHHAELTHEEVTEAVNASREPFAALLKGLIAATPTPDPLPPALPPVFGTPL